MLTDHSPSARIARGLDRDRLEEKIAEVERVRERRGLRKPRILLGAEVDILADGRLDYPEEILARFDVVVAAVHSSFRQSRDRMTMNSPNPAQSFPAHCAKYPDAPQWDDDQSWRPTRVSVWMRQIGVGPDCGIGLAGYLSGRNWR